MLIPQDVLGVVYDFALGLRMHFLMHEVREAYMRRIRNSSCDELAARPHLYDEWSEMHERAHEEFEESNAFSDVRYIYERGQLDMQAALALDAPMSQEAQRAVLGQTKFALDHHPRNAEYLREKDRLWSPFRNYAHHLHWMREQPWWIDF